MITVSLVSYNSPDVTMRAIESCLDGLKTSGRPFEMIVVDNASTTGNADLIRQRFPDIHLIALDENIGFGRAHNVAIRESSGDIVFIVNSDILLLNDVFPRIGALFSQMDNLAAVGPLVEESDGRQSPTSRDRIFNSLPLTTLSVMNAIFPVVHRTDAAQSLRVLKGTVLRNHESVRPSFESRQVEWVDGMFVAFSRHYLEQTGVFDSFYFFDHEIGDLLLRLQQVGGRVYYDAGSRIMHLGGHSRKQNPKTIHASLVGLAHYFYNNRRPYFTPIALEIIVLSSVRAVGYLLRGQRDRYRFWLDIAADVLKYLRQPVAREYTVYHLKREA